jgi:FkbM family methyltransferase
MVTFGKKLVQSTLERFGYGLAPLETPRPNYGLDCLFPLLKQFGFVPTHVLDVGANKGNWTRAALRYFPDADYTLVEPQDELRVHIQDLIERGCKIRWIHAGAAEKSGSLPFTISYRKDSSTFVTGEREAQADGLRRITLEVRTLDEIVSSASLPIPDMVKIDAEGFDLRVLAGASSLVGKTDVFFIEAAVRGTYENSVLEVVRRMSDRGYGLLDVTDINRSPKFGVLWLFELAFLRRGSPLLDAVTSYE